MAEEEASANFFVLIFDTVFEFLGTGHASVIHFPIIGILMGFAAGFTALLLGMSIDGFINKEWMTEPRVRSLQNFIDRFEFTSYILLILGLGGYVIAGITGFLTSGSISNAINHELLEYKVRLSIFVFFLLIGPISLKTYFGLVYKKNIFNNKSRIIPLLYLSPLIPAAIMTMIIAGAGGRYVYGHSILDTFGLSWLLPGEAP